MLAGILAPSCPLNPKAGRSIYRYTLAELIEALARAEHEGRLVEKIRFYSQASLLIIDEIGYLPIGTARLTQARNR